MQFSPSERRHHKENIRIISSFTSMSPLPAGSDEQDWTRIPAKQKRKGLRGKNGQKSTGIAEEMYMIIIRIKNGI